MTTTKELTKENLGLVRKYLVEIVIVIQSICIGYLYRELNDVKNKMVEYYQKDNKAVIEALLQNADVMERNIKVLDIRQNPLQ